MAAQGVFDFHYIEINVKTFMILIEVEYRVPTNIKTSSLLMSQSF